MYFYWNLVLPAKMIVLAMKTVKKKNALNIWDTKYEIILDRLIELLVRNSNISIGNLSAIFFFKEILFQCGIQTLINFF